VNLAAILCTNAQQDGQKIAIRCQGESLSYAEVWNLTERVAGLLHNAGVAQGDRVGLSMRESALHLIAHFAVARLGGVIVPMDHRWTDTEKKAASAAFATGLVLVDEGTIEGVRTQPLTVDSLPDADFELPPIAESNSDLLISLSSGTTGKPKGALISHRHLYERFVSQWNAIGYGKQDTFAILTPFYFGAGRSFGMSLLVAGGTVVIAPPPLTPAEIVTTLSDASISATFLPPTMLRRLFELHQSGTAPMFEQIQYLIVSGEPLFENEAYECIEKVCANLYSYYASSEGGGISVLHADDFNDFAATVGKPTYQTEVQIVDENDNELANENVGRLRYRGPGVATRYLDGDGNEHDAAVGGWFYPGDLAEILASGHIALRGRDKDVIIRGGVNVYPAEIEATLLSHDNIREAAVVGHKNESRGEIVRAFVSVDAGLGQSQIEAWCEDRLAPYKRPQEYVFLPELPKRSSGKIDKKALVELS
jgi:acyl-CoA synthetase (AMP-forming)/AMP-acid ligase II